MRVQAELKITQILFECDMTMYRHRASSTCTQSSHNNSRGGAGTSQSQYSDISTPPPQNDFQYLMVPGSLDDTTNQTESEQNTFHHVIVPQPKDDSNFTSYEELMSFTIQNDASN